MGMGQIALPTFFSPSCSRLFIPTPFLSASSAMFCCHTSGFEHGTTSWIWFLAAVCCQCFPTEDRDGIQQARGNGGQAGKVHSRWRLRQNQISTGAMFFSLPSIQLHGCLLLLNVSPIYFFISEIVDCLPCMLYQWMGFFLDADFYISLHYQHGSPGAYLDGHRQKDTYGIYTHIIRTETFLPLS